MAKLKYDTSETPDVAVLMGSNSDWPTMKMCAEKLTEFGIPHQVRVLSAHRHPAHVEDYMKNTTAKVYICAAGLAAHLAGVVASQTEKPVIAVPMKGGVSDGLDALLSMVQMPYGIPVATVAIGSHGARNSAILALQMLAIADENYAKTLQDFRKSISDPGAMIPSE